MTAFCRVFQNVENNNIQTFSYNYAIIEVSDVFNVIIVSVIRGFHTGVPLIIFKGK